MPEDSHALQESIRAHRLDLVASVHELENIVRAKLDVKARLVRWSERIVERVLARPVPYLVIGGAMLVLLFRRRR